MVTRWPVLAVAAGVDASAGLLAAATANGVDAGHEPAAVFALFALPLVLCHLVLLPGWVWSSGPVRLLNLLRRAILALLATCLVAMAGSCLGMGLAAVPAPFDNGPAWAELGVWIGRVVLALVVVAAGALVGLGVATGEGPRQSPPGRPLHAGFKMHVWGGAIAVVPPLLLAWAADASRLGLDFAIRQTWPALLLLGPVALAIAGAPHTMLVLLGTSGRPATRPLLRRGGACAAAFCCLAASVIATTTPPTPRPLHVSPDGRYAVVLVSDLAFGQVETLRVIVEPGTPRAAVIFEQVGDVPSQFIRWVDGATAELSHATHQGGGTRVARLTCRERTCAVE